MAKCGLCGCICDPSDLLGGVCDDCIYIQNSRNNREDFLKQLSEKEKFEQLEMELKE